MTASGSENTLHPDSPPSEAEHILPSFEEKQQECSAPVETEQNTLAAELLRLQEQIDTLSKEVKKLTVVCKDGMEYSQRYQRNTVTVLQEENKRKDRYMTGMLLIDLLKPIAEVCSKIERRIRKSESSAEKKFLGDLLEEIEDTATEEYNVTINRTAVGQPRPENIARVDSVLKTNDIQFKNTVAESLCASWTLDGHLIQKERVVMYQYAPDFPIATEGTCTWSTTESTPGTAEVPSEAVQSEDSIQGPPVNAPVAHNESISTADAGNDENHMNEEIDDSLSAPYINSRADN